MLRRRKERESELVADPDQPAAAAANQTALETVVEEALRALRDKEHDCVVARFYEDRSFKEIAALFGISEDTAQKRVSRGLARLRALLAKRGIKVPVASIPGMLSGHWAHELGAHAAQPAAGTAQALLKGKGVVLADHALHSWWWQSTLSLCVNLAIPAMLLLGGAWVTWEWSKPPAPFRVSDARIEALGKAWAQVDLRVVRARQQFLPTPNNDPRFQEVVREAQAINAETVRLAGELSPLLTRAHDRDRVAEFLTVELRETLVLDPAQQRAVFSWTRKRLADGATLRDALTAVAQSAPTEATEIKAMLSPAQQLVFDQTYGADGLGLFTYAKTVISNPVKF